MTPSLDEKISLEIVALSPKSPNTLLWEFGSLAAAAQYHHLYNLIKKYVKEGSRVLDWETGNGHLTYWLLKKGYQASAFGFPMPRSYINWFDDKFPYHQETKEPTKLPYKTAEFDAVASSGTLEHVRDSGGDEVASLKELNRILRPGGVFVCCHFVNKYSWIEWVARKFFPNKHHHAQLYTAEMIRQMLQDSNFELLEVKRYGIFPRNWLGKLNGFAKTSLFISRAYGLLDAFFGFIFNPFCQNFLFVARKRR